MRERANLLRESQFVFIESATSFLRDEMKFLLSVF